MKQRNLVYLVLLIHFMGYELIHSSSTLPTLPTLSTTPPAGANPKPGGPKPSSSNSLPTLPSLSSPSTSATKTKSSNPKPPTASGTTTSVLPTLPSLSSSTTNKTSTTSNSISTPAVISSSTSTIPSLPSLSTSTSSSTTTSSSAVSSPTTTTGSTKAGSQSSASSININETMMPIIHIQNNATDKGTLKKIVIQISNPKTKKSMDITGDINVNIPAKSTGKDSGPVIAFNPTIQNSPFPPEFNGVKSITIDSTTITFPKMFSGLSAIHAINITKTNGQWALDTSVHTTKETPTTPQQMPQQAGSKNTITKSTNSNKTSQT